MSEAAPPPASVRWSAVLGRHCHGAGGESGSRDVANGKSDVESASGEVTNASHHVEDAGRPVAGGTWEGTSGALDVENGICDV